MSPDRRRLGVHLPLGAGMVKAADRAHEIGATAIQVFSDNPTAWRRRSAPPVEQPTFRARLAEHGIETVAVHAAYLVNLAGPDPAFFAQSVGLLAEELRVAPGFGATLVNVHAGSHRDTSPEDGVARLAEGVRRVLAAADEGGWGGPEAPRLVIENMAGGGFAIGVTIEDLARIADAAGAAGVPADRLGFCLDLAHLWGGGFDLSDPDEVDALVESFDRRLGLGRLAMLHLNDSRAALASRLDRHQHVGAGGIGERGFGAVLRHPALARVPSFLETPGMDEGYDGINLERVRALIEGASLDALPPEALTMKGSRARTAPPDDDVGDQQDAGRSKRATRSAAAARARVANPRQPQPA